MNIQRMDYRPSQYFNPNVKTCLFWQEHVQKTVLESGAQSRGFRNEPYQDIPKFLGFVNISGKYLLWGSDNAHILV